MTQKRSDRFKPIHSIAQQSEDKAAHTLGKIQHQLNEHQQKLTELMQYHQDYIARFNEQAAKGMSVVQVQSYQKFISQLKVAITQQKEHITLATEACDSSRVDWTVERQKTQVLEKVMTRYQRQEQKTANRKEQRLSDEHVSNQFWHKTKTI